jgi:hypothetical protein
MPKPDSRNRSDDVAMAHREHRVEVLIKRLPYRLQTAVRWLSRPSSRWLRIPTGSLLIAGSLLSILPIFGVWMLPAGLVLLAQDVPPLRRSRDRILDWIERRRPDWFITDQHPSPEGEAPTAGDRQAASEAAAEQAGAEPAEALAAGTKRDDRTGSKAATRRVAMAGKMPVWFRAQATDR